jgi:hypothetical protein
MPFVKYQHIERSEDGKMTDDQKRFCEFKYSGGTFIEAIAKDIGVSGDKIADHLKNVKLWIHYGIHFPKITQQQSKQIPIDRANGMKFKDLSRKYGITIASVSYHLRKSR